MVKFISHRVLPISIAVLISLFFCFQLAYGKKPVPVIVAKAKVDNMVDRLEALGTLGAKESVTVTASITDTITRVNFDDGQRVNTGYILVEMTSAEEHAILAEELSRFEESKKQLDRLLQLLKQDAVAQTQLDQQRRDFETAQARLRQVESKLQDRLILAPFPGVVGLRNISVGALVEPGDVITTLDDDSTMKLDFQVPATFLGNLDIGVPITAKASSYQDKTFAGTISSIDSRVDTATRSITARAILQNNDRTLKPGMLMQVELLKNSRRSIIIPEEAIIPIGNSTFVYRVDTSENISTAQKTVVKVGSRRGGEIEIVEGLTEGDLVIVHGSIKVRPGAAVSIRAVDDGSKTLQEMLEQKGGGEKST